jgi:ketosteroid isomerase-like protein
MRYTLLAAVMCVAMGTAGAAQAQDAQLMAPIQKFLEAFNKGDAAGAAATHLADDDLVIIDEVAPHLWRGAGAFKAWTGDLASHDKKNAVTDQAVTIGKPAVAEAEGDFGYVVVPAAYAFKQGGKPMHETAHMTFALKKTAGGWMIHAWAWTGTKPVPAKP